MSFWECLCDSCGKAMYFYSKKFEFGDLMDSKRVVLPTGEHPVIGSVIKCHHCGATPKKPILAQKEFT
jgi:hypothetical protein